MNWSTQQIRKTFLDYFESKGHKVVPSAPMVVKNDPTLMFTNAGMNQFKDIFLGNEKAPHSRVADTQKCLRVSGKHNDLEEVGVDTYHHTMFEMLGNWSFNDYFKTEAIGMAWELLTDVYKIDKDRLYVTVFGGDQEDNTAEDTEAFDIWSRHITPSRILKCSKKDNFWEMGDAGPCGPCSEIHVDIRTDEERKKQDGKSLVNMDHPQVIEVWNLVFIQFNRNTSGELNTLPQKHVDTGMGLERLAMVLQGKQSNYEIDLFRSIISKLEEISSTKYTAGTDKASVAFRVIADHLRAISFAIADGQLPSNSGAGYVIRRILRRAVRYGYSFLNLDRPFIYELVPDLADLMGVEFDELHKQLPFIQSVIKEEEQGFLRTLDNGIKRLNLLMEGQTTIEGASAFELYDTYGFPIDLTQLIASEKNISVDLDGFNQELLKQKVRSRSSNTMDSDDWVILKESEEKIEFVGYELSS
ncbi:MAG: alanine--tRNA ligase, partial [Flavobacteriales bacterium]|nr:alanine--tRNA ligase [Flavobacteriales bacterium]